MRKREELIGQIAKSGLCVKCKGTKMLCGRTECPILKRYYALQMIERKLNRVIYGSSPPDVFVGRIGYPKVYVGPLLPPVLGETEYMANPGIWIGMNIGDFVDMRTSLVRGMKRISVYDANDPNYEIVKLQELAMADRHVDSEVHFSKIPRGTVSGDIDVEPHGPRGKMERFIVENVRVDTRVERKYYDEQNARESLIELYGNGVSIYSLQKVFSMGILGKKKRFVPTRWSITAVDSIIGNHFVEEIKNYESIDRPMVFKSSLMENVYAVILIPGVWSYELVEAWYPGTFWNPYGARVFMVSSHEFYGGRREYAEIGGCYYAARLIVAEKLREMRKQATAIILREAQPSYIMPVGVWQVRENVRNALNGKPVVFDDTLEAIEYATSLFRIRREDWYRNSQLLQYLKRQRRIDEFAIH